MSSKCWWFVNWSFKISLVLFIVVVAVGEFGCFWWSSFTWHIPANSNDGLNLLFVSDSQIPVGNNHGYEIFNFDMLLIKVSQ